MWRNIRLSLLVGILVFVALGSWLDRHRSTSWESTVRVGAFPVAGDTERYGGRLRGRSGHGAIAAGQRVPGARGAPLRRRDR